MQVSWIDPDEIAKLAALLEGPVPRVETAPESIPLPDFAANFFGDNTPAPERATDVGETIAAPAPERVEAAGAATSAEVSHIREKLKNIRARAQEAGLIPQAASVPAVPVVAEPETKPVELTTPTPTASSPPAAPVAESKSEASPVAEAKASETTKPAPAGSPFLKLDGSLGERLQSFVQWARKLAPCEDILLVDDHGDLLWGGPARSGLAVSAILAISASLRSSAKDIASPPAVVRTHLGDRVNLSLVPCPTHFGLVTLAFFNAPELTEQTAACLREAVSLCIEATPSNPARGTV